MFFKSNQFEIQKALSEKTEFFDLGLNPNTNYFYDLCYFISKIVMTIYLSKLLRTRPKYLHMFVLGLK